MQKKKLKKPSCLYTIIALFVSESFHVGKRDIKKELEENEDRNLFSKKGVEIEHENKLFRFCREPYCPRMKEDITGLKKEEKKE